MTTNSTFLTSREGGERKKMKEKRIQPFKSRESLDSMLLSITHIFNFSWTFLANAQTGAQKVSSFLPPTLIRGWILLSRNLVGFHCSLFPIGVLFIPCGAEGFSCMDSPCSDMIFCTRPSPSRACNACYVSVLVIRVSLLLNTKAKCVILRSPANIRVLRRLKQNPNRPNPQRYTARYTGQPQTNSCRFDTTELKL